MNENYVFPAVITEEDDQITISFPTLNGITTCAEKEDNIIEMAQELLALTLIDYEDSHQEIPCGDFEPIHPMENERIVYVHVWLPYFRSKTREVYVKKTLTIPSWLDVLAKQNEINFSSTLTEALKKKLGIE